MSATSEHTGKRRRIILTTTSIVAILLIGSGCFGYFGYYLPDMKERAEKERMVREYYEMKFDQYRDENDRYADYEVDVAFLGDSLTDGCDLERYYPGPLKSNRGIGGETTFDLERRLDISLYDLKPKVTVILIGGNNVHSMLDNYEDIILGIKENVPQTRILICSLTSMGGDWAEKNRTAAYNNVILHKLAERHGCEFVDLFSPLLDVGSGEIRKEYTHDGAHLTHLGYEVISGEIRPVITRLLGEWVAVTT